MSSQSVTRLMRESFLPRDAFGRIVLLIVVFRSPIIWAASVLVRGEPVEVTALYRPGGDIQYFELVAALARGELGESNLFEAAGAGVHPFPLGSIAFHALLLAAFGAWGLLLADSLISYCFAGALGFLGRTIGLRARWAIAFAGLVATNAYVVLWPLTNRLGWGKDLLWGDRFPRPFVAEVFSILGLGVAATTFLHPAEARRLSFWVGAGVVLSLTVQSDIYSAFIVGIVMVVAWVAAFLRAPAARRSLLVGAATVAMTVAATAWPFVLQRMATSPELLRRWGVYPLDRGVALRWITEVPVAGPVLFVVTAGVALVVIRRAPKEEGAPLREGVLFWAVACVVAAVALPLFFGILGQGMYPYMFPDRLRRICLYGACFVALMLIGALVGASRPWWPGARRAALFLVPVAMIGLVGVRAADAVRRETHTRRNWYDFSGLGSYRTSFTELVRELDRRSDEEVVLATLDQQVHVYWQTFGGARAFVPDAFVSIAPDAVLEERFALFGRILGMPTEAWLDLVQVDGYQTMFLAVSKYSANRVYTLGARSQYTTAQLAEIDRRGLFDAFSPVVPRHELERLRVLYEATSEREAAARLDLVVVTNDPRFASLYPDPAQFELVFENRIFRLYSRRSGG